MLCATRAHRAEVVGLAPRAVRRTFTLREFARLTDAVESERIDTTAGKLAALHEHGHFRAAGTALVAAGTAARGVVPRSPRRTTILWIHWAATSMPSARARMLSRPPSTHRPVCSLSS